MSLKSELEELASSLEEAVTLATTRIEHVRVAGHAARARRLADACPEGLEPASTDLRPTG